MTEIEIYNWCKSRNIKDNIIEFPDNFYKELDFEGSQIIKNYFPQNTFFKLPKHEIDFFEWLKINDKSIWDDLWSAEDIHKPYYVSLTFFPLLVKQGYRGFPICDLLSNDNYYFVPNHLASKEAEIFAESAKTIYMNKDEMTIPQLLAMEISLEPIDIWHFSYKHKISIDESKKAVSSLVDDELLIHLKSANHLIPFIDF